MTKKKWEKIIWIATCIILAAFIGWTTWGNVTIQTTYYDISDEDLPEAFEGYKIVQVSDLHNAVFGKDNSTLIEKIDTEEPDIIVMTGDLIDSYHTDIQAALDFTEEIAKIAPCYFITGNHEASIDRSDYDELEQALRKQGVIVLRNSFVNLTKDSKAIQLIGADDPAFMRDAENYMTSGEIILKELEDVDYGEDWYKILLSHRPEAFGHYSFVGFNIVFSGHAHGGQFRFPFIGGAFAPDQGLFPKYDAGLYQKDNTTMVVSRGIGSSIIPVRVNNRPEIVVTTLHCQ